MPTKIVKKVSALKEAEWVMETLLLMWNDPYYYSKARALAEEWRKRYVRNCRHRRNTR